MVLANRIQELLVLGIKISYQFIEGCMERDRRLYAQVVKGIAFRFIATRFLFLYIYH